MNETTAQATWTDGTNFWFAFRDSDKPFAMLTLDTAGHINVFNPANGALVHTELTLPLAQRWAEEHL